MSVTTLAAYDVDFDGLEVHVLGWMSEAIDLRHGTGGDPAGNLRVVNPVEGFDAINTELLRVRGRSDRVDEILSKTTQAKSRARRAEEAAKFAAEIAYMEASQQNAARRTREFTSAAERHADASLDSIEEKRIAHQAARLVSITAEAHEVVLQIHWQLDAIRKDLRATLHALQFESSLER